MSSGILGEIQLCPEVIVALGETLSSIFVVEQWMLPEGADESWRHQPHCRHVFGQRIS